MASEKENIATFRRRKNSRLGLRWLAYLYIAGTLLLFGSCRDDQMASSGEDALQYGVTDSSGSSSPVIVHGLEDTLEVMERLLQLQRELRTNGSNRVLAEKLKSLSFDTTSGCFLTVGKGTINPNHPASAQAAGRKLAAGYDGKRWAVYLKAWHTGNWVPFGDPVKGEVVYSKILHETLSRDTLYQLLLVPVGSIVVRDLP